MEPQTGTERAENNDKKAKKSSALVLNNSVWKKLLFLSFLYFFHLALTNGVEQFLAVALRPE